MAVLSIPFGGIIHFSVRQLIVPGGTEAFMERWEKKVQKKIAAQEKRARDEKIKNNPLEKPLKPWREPEIPAHWRTFEQIQQEQRSADANVRAAETLLREYGVTVLNDWSPWVLAGQLGLKAPAEFVAGLQQSSKPRALDPIAEAALVALLGSALRRSGSLWNEWRSGIPQWRQIVLSGLCVRKAELRGLNFSNMAVQRANFRGADLGTNFTGEIRERLSDSILEERPSNFRSAILSGCDFTSAHIAHAEFCNADLRQTKFRTASVQEADFTGADLRHADFTGARIDGGGTRFNDADLTGAIFHDAVIIGARFSGATLTGVDFSSAKVHNVQVTDEQRRVVQGLHVMLLGPDWSGASYTFAHAEDP